MLGTLGLPLDDADEAVLRALIAFAGSAPEQIAVELGYDAAEVRQGLRRLEEAGLARRDEDGTHWHAVPPELVLAPAVARAQERVRRAESAVTDLVSVYHRERAARSAVELVELVDGIEEQGRRLQSLLASAQHGIRAFQSGSNRSVPVSATIDDPADPDPDPTDARSHALPGVGYRIVVDAGFLAEPAAVPALRQRIAEGAEVRVAGSRLLKLAIADDAIAMVQLTERVAVMLRPPLLALAHELFETVWRDARPYLSAPSTLPEQDRQILQLMLSGLTDTAVAAQIGTSARTVQRRLRALMDLAEVSTRAQLGSYATRQGWL